MFTITLLILQKIDFQTVHQYYVWLFASREKNSTLFFRLCIELSVECAIACSQKCTKNNRMLSLVGSHTPFSGECG